MGKVTVADVLAAQPVTTNLLKFMRASIKMIGVSNLQSFIASMTQKLTLSDISDESKNYLDKASITTACLRIKSNFFFFQAEDGIRDKLVTGVQTCALPIYRSKKMSRPATSTWERSISLRLGLKLCRQRAPAAPSWCSSAPVP